MARRILPLVTAAALAFFGCASSPASVSVDGDASPQALRVVVTPLNLAVRTPPELEGRGDRVWFEVIRYFQERDGQVATFSPNSAERMWLTVTENLDAPDRRRALQLAYSRMAQALAEQRSYDLLVVPSLVLRPGRLKGRYASWDGVHRPVPNGDAFVMDNVGDAAFPFGSVAVAGLTGNVGAVSLHVSVLRPDGTLFYEGLGGIDLVQQLRRASPWDGLWTYETREDLLAEPAHIREGVERAFGHQLLAAARER